MMDRILYDDSCGFDGKESSSLHRKLTAVLVHYTRTNYFSGRGCM